MADEQPNQPRAEQIRILAAEQAKSLHAALEAAESRSITKETTAAVQELTKAMGLAALWGLSVLSDIAAELAEANSRDREAEIRAKNAEAFVAGIQAELGRQGVIIPGGMPNVKPPRGK